MLSTGRYDIIMTVEGNKRKQFRHRQKMGEEHLQELGRNSKVQQGSRDQLKAPSRRSSQEQRKSVLHAVGSTSRTQPQKGSWTVYHAPPKKERGFTYEQHRNSEQGQRASRAAPHGRRADSRDREHSGRDQGAHDRHRRRHADGHGLQDHLEGRDQQPVRQHSVQEGHAGACRALHQVQHQPPVHCGVRGRQ